MRRIRAYIRLMFQRRWLGNSALFLKVAVYRIFGSWATFFIALWVTHDILTSTKIMLVDICVKILLSFIYEVNWNNLIRKM